MIDKARELALKVLYKIDVDKAYSNIVLDEMIKQNINFLNEGFIISESNILHFGHVKYFLTNIFCLSSTYWLIINFYKKRKKN